MPKQIALELFTNQLFEILDETFEDVHGIYLDRNTSLFETLDTVTAEDASRPVSARCASIAAQVNHVRLYLDILHSYIQHNEVGEVDWAASWQIGAITADGWTTLKGQLRSSYTSVVATLKGLETWQGEDELAGALAIVVHSAYHLGEIRQALCTIKGS